MPPAAAYYASKVPEVTVVFWIIKIAATTLGETGGDTVTMTLGWGYLAGTAIFLSALAVLIMSVASRASAHRGVLDVGPECCLLRTAVRAAPIRRDVRKRSPRPDQLLRQAVRLFVDEIAATADETALHAVN